MTPELREANPPFGPGHGAEASRFASAFGPRPSTFALRLPLPEPLREARLRAPQSQEAESEERLRACQQAAYERGWRDGQKALSEQLLQQRADLQALEKGVLEALRGALPQLVRESEQALTALALEVAQKLVAGLPVSVEMVEAALREALAQTEEAAELHVYLHPDDLELLRRVDSALLHPEPPGPALHLHPAPEVGRGGCLVKSRFGTLDAQRQTKLDLIRKAVLA